MVAEKMNDDELVKDSLDRVSGQLRKAVGLNRHEMGGLRNIVSQMKRDRNRSVGLLSKKQQDFLQKQARLLPAINARRKSRKMVNQVIPLSQENIGLPKEKTNLPKLGHVVGSNSAQFSVLPPIRSSGSFTKDIPTTGNEAKLRRISDYQKEFSSLQENLSNAHKFASCTPIESQSPKMSNERGHSHEEKKGSFIIRRQLQSLSETDESSDGSSHFDVESTRLGKDSGKTARKDQRFFSDNDLAQTNTQIKSSLNDTESSLSLSIDEVALANEPSEETKDSRVAYYEANEKKDYWQIVRKQIGTIAMMNKKRHSQYLDQLYQEIRQCRYIRKPKKKNPNTGLWYESGDESENEEISNEQNLC